jgi:peptide-methionine (S)-S-oxide reductase
MLNLNHNYIKATFAAGCFWCYEPIFSALQGVISVIPGYSGDSSKLANYEDVSSGNTNHAEAFQIEFDPTIISYSELLDVFWHVHNPTTLNQQGNDVGSQYRSAIFYHDQIQKQQAEQSKQQLADSGEYLDPIVTQISPYQDFFPAEDYHQKYYERHKNAGYSEYVIKPKLEKFKHRFSNKLAVEYI